MRGNGQIPLRFLHSVSANFTLPIRRKPLSTALLPFSLKKISLKPEKQDCNRLPMSRGGNAHSLPLPAILTAAVLPVLQQPLSAALVRAEFLEVSIDPSPPDLQALNATFLI